MKFRGVGALPSSVALWLEQQLEERGIDSAVYSAYILSLLHRQPFDVNDLPSKGRKTNSISCDLEELEKNTGPNLERDPSEKAVELDNLVDELCVKLKESACANEGDTGCLKEKTNSGNRTIGRLFNPESSANPFLDSAPLPRDLHDSITGWTRPPQNNRARARRRGNSECSPKVSKRKDNKENVGGVMRGRMRSRSTVKQSGCSSHRMRSSAKSLDRNDDEAVVRFVRGEIRGRKHVFGDEREAKLSRTPGKRDKAELSEFDKDLPMDFQQLLQSPDDSSLLRHPKQNQPSRNFIQCGTNITSSIWSDTSEKMDEDEVPLPWETPKWSEARSSILSSAWKYPFVYEKDVESTSLALANEGSFFSFFGASTLLNHNKNSSFTEVTPSAHFEKKNVPISQAQPDVQEEDLLTSMKTHFRPIKDDGCKSGYKDGSSFPVSTNFEPVKYRRSESGAFYLGSDNKYYEFKRPYDKPSEFVPKFKVCRTEKFCQTDDIMSDPEDKSLSADADTETEEDLLEGTGQEEFYFPGDEQLAEEMLNGSEEEEEDSQPQIQVSGWVTTWPVSAAIWSNDDTLNNNNNNNTWVLGSGNKQSGNDLADGHSEQYTRLKDELFEEGEELLSDLSSIHLFLNPDRMDDPHAQAQLHSNVSYQQPFSILNGNHANEPLF